MSPHVSEKTGTRHTNKQWKVEGGGEGGEKPLNLPHKMLLLPTTPINITKPLTTIIIGHVCP